ncbi:unnamed protein product [Peniophora sp. CBMAI 1063]|nr:unnamed protein product [Peniophora sp. CBMAI 1063]
MSSGNVTETSKTLDIDPSECEARTTLERISTTLSDLLDLEKGIKTLRSEWSAVMNIAQRLKDLVDEQQDLDGHDGLEDASLNLAAELDSCLPNILDTLKACKSTPGRFTGRFRAHASRGELSKRISGCYTELKDISDLFGCRLKDISTAVNSPPSASVFASPPYLANDIHGRDIEIANAVDLILSDANAHVAVLGAGGIGKTSVALAVMHHPSIKARYADGRRLFISCESMASGAHIHKLLQSSGLVPTQPSSRDTTPLDALITHISSLSPCLLCLDGLDLITSFDNVPSLKAVLSKLSAIDGLALLVTMRGAVLPPCAVWSQPALPPLGPLTLRAALAIWDDICGSHDSYARKLVELVDHDALSTTILAYLANEAPSKDLLLRWQQEHTALLCIGGSGDRAENVNASIAGSLRPLSKQFLGADAVDLLSVLSQMPTGLLVTRIHAFSRAFANHLADAFKLLNMLKRRSLLHVTEEGTVRVLSPLRDYMQTYEPPPRHLLSRLTEFHVSLIDGSIARPSSDVASSMPLSKAEFKNVSHVLSIALTQEKHHPEHITAATASFLEMCQTSFVSDTALSTQFASISREPFLPIATGKNVLVSAQESRDADIVSANMVPSMNVDRGLGTISEGDESTAAGPRTDDGSDVTVTPILASFTPALSPASAAISHLDDMSDTQADEANHMIASGYAHIENGELEDARNTLLQAMQAPEVKESRLRKICCFTGLGDVYLRMGLFEYAQRMLLSALELSPAIISSEAEASVLYYLEQVRSRLPPTEEIDPTDMGISIDVPGTDVDDARSVHSHDSEASDLDIPWWGDTKDESDLDGQSPEKGDSAPQRSETQDPLPVRLLFEVILPLFIPRERPLQDGSTMLRAVAFVVDHYTIYDRLWAAHEACHSQGSDPDSSSGNDALFERIKTDLVQQWGIIAGILLTVVGVASTVFVAAPNSIVPIGNVALCFLGVSATVAIFGFSLCLALLVLCWTRDAKQFKKLTFDIYDDYCFFAITAAIPSLSLLPVLICAMLFVLAVVFGKWPSVVITTVVVFAVLVSLQYICKGAGKLSAAVRKGYILSLTQFGSLWSVFKLRVGGVFASFRTFASPLPATQNTPLRPYDV